MKIKICVVLAALAFLIQDTSAFYNPSTGRWLSRDPIEEMGGAGLYMFVANRATIRIDGLGLIDRSSCSGGYELGSLTWIRRIRRMEKWFFAR